MLDSKSWYFFILCIAVFVETGVLAQNNGYDHQDDTSRLSELRSTAEENIKKSGEGGDRDLDLRLPHLAPIEKWFGGFDFERRNDPALQLFVKFALNFIGRTSTDPKLVAEATKQGKFQDVIPDTVPFPCDTTFGRSLERPSDVDHVRPGDIDVVAALGDSLVAGNGLAGSSFQHSMLTNRGMSAFAGGQDTWRKYWTLPNIIKEFNPNVTGYSTGDTLYYEQHYNQQLNLAEAGAVINDLPDMARILKTKMLKHPKINMEKDWKLVSIFTGGVDFCLDLCFWKRPQDGPINAERAIRNALDYLMDNFPRTIVIFFTYLDLGEVVNSLKYEGICKMHLEPPCPCIFGKAFKTIQKDYLNLLQRMLDVQTSVASDPKYSSRPDFRVSTHEEIRKYGVQMLPTKVKKDGTILTDERYVSSDCFHLSQRGHASFAVNMWNALLTPRNQSFVPKIQGFTLKCPTINNQYFHV